MRELARLGGGFYYETAKAHLMVHVNQKATKKKNKRNFANAKKVFVIREDLEKFLHVDIYRLNISNPVSLIAGRNFYLQPSDIVFLPPKGIVKWNRVVSLLTPSSDLFQSYNPLIQRGVGSTKTSGKHKY